MGQKSDHLFFLFIIINKKWAGALQDGPLVDARDGKGDGVGMGQDFSPTPWGRAGMGLDFLDPPRPTPPLPTPHY